MIRAKFRCMSIAKDYMGLTTVRLCPVIPKKGLPNFEENRQFWEYSPSGECNLSFKGDHAHRTDDEQTEAEPVVFEEGSFYYIDMEKVAPTSSTWTLSTLMKHIGGSAEVSLSRYVSTAAGLQNGWLKIGLSDKAAPAQHAFGEPAEGWSVRFTFAHGQEKA